MNKRFPLKMCNSLYIFLSLLIYLLREKSPSLHPPLCPPPHTHTPLGIRGVLKYNLQFLYFGVSKCILIVVSDSICVLMLKCLILPLKTLQGQTYIPWIYEVWFL